MGSEMFKVVFITLPMRPVHSRHLSSAVVFLYAAAQSCAAIGPCPGLCSLRAGVNNSSLRGTWVA